MDREEKDAQLKEFIQRLSSTTFKGATDPNIKDSIETLRHIYENEYRHMYSSIFATLRT